MSDRLYDLNKQAALLSEVGIGKLREAGIKLTPHPKGGHVASFDGGSVHIIGAEAVAGGFIEPGPVSIQTHRAAMKHRKMVSPKDDADSLRILLAAQKRKLKAKKQSLGMKAED